MTVRLLPSPAPAEPSDLDELRRAILAHRHGVYRHGLRVCRTTEDAEDALQETLWAATRGVKAFRGTASSVVSWMFTIIRRECFRLVDRRRDVPLEPLEAVDEPVDPEAEISARRRAQLLAEALSELEPMHREAVLLRDIEQLSAPEAAARLGISVPALKSRLPRAREQLRGQVLARADQF